MPIDPRRRDDIVAAVASQSASAPLPRNTARLLAAMFASEDVCQRSLEDLAAEGFARNRLPGVLKHLVEAGFLSRQPGSGRVPDTYRLAPAPGAAMSAIAARRSSDRPCRAAGPQRQGPHLAYARAWSARNRQPRQHRGPITRAFMEVLKALLWGFHNARHGRLLPVIRDDRRQGGVQPGYRL